MISKKKHIVWLMVFVVLGSTFGFLSHSMSNNEETYRKIDKGLFYLKEVFEKVAKNYVDKLDPESLSKSAIQGMLKEFDPYTVFFEDPGSHQMQMITRGKYGGVGMEISLQNKQITVISPIEGTPAKRAGIRAGDVIFKIDRVPTKDMVLETASQKLRGKVGTTVVLEVVRPGVDAPLSFDLVREEIVLKDVTYAAFIEPGTIYLRLSAFSEKAAEELREHISKLRKQGEIKRVVLDMRDNPGGLLSSAVEVASIFLKPGQLVVYTRGSHEKENKFYSRGKPLLLEEPLAVLINESSASASEIVAGAIQDLDRGILVGVSTFGKGLVQKVYPIDRLAQAYLKITTAKYYVPSGRSIQKDDYKKNTDLFVDMSDSVEYNRKTNYYTQNQRVVHGGGGIRPDVKVKQHTFDRLLQNLVSKRCFFRFVVDYLALHPELKKSWMLKVDKKMLAAFKRFIEREKFDFTLEGEGELKKFLEIANTQKYDQKILTLGNRALKAFDEEKEKKFDLQRQTIAHLLEAEFVEKIDGSRAHIKKMLTSDKQSKQALKLLHDMEEYQQILAIR